jgi:hypothetical protein
MSAITTSAVDLITGALREIKVLAAGETARAEDAADSLQVLNDLLESWSIDHLTVWAVVENILSFTAGQYQYLIGNPDGGTFSGTAVLASNTLSGVTVPANLVIGGTVYDNKNGGQNLIPASTTVLAFDPIGGTVTMSNNALANSSGADVVTFTTPGDFAIPRPLRITNSFTRITASGSTGLDYPIDFEGGRDRYTAIGLKGIQAPWPVVGWYNPTFPLGNVYFYPNPSGFGELHLFTDTIFSDFQTVTQAVNLPPGYARAIKTNLALELASQFGKQPSAILMKRAAESLAMVKALNANPALQAFYDRDIVRASRTDAGWIMHGGFR